MQETMNNWLASATAIFARMDVVAWRAMERKLCDRGNRRALKIRALLFER